MTRHTHSTTRRTSLALLACALTLGTGACESAQPTTADATAPGERRIITIPKGVTVDRNERFLRAVEQAHKAWRTADPVSAEEQYTQAVDTYAEIPAAWNNLGVLQMQRREFLTASDSFTLAADLSPTDPRPLYNQALLWDERGYLQDALHLYERSLTRDPNYLPSLRGAIRAQALLNEGDETTLTLLKRAVLLEKDPKWLAWLRRQRVRLEARVAEMEPEPE